MRAQKPILGNHMKTFNSFVSLGIFVGLTLAVQQEAIAMCSCFNDAASKFAKILQIHKRILAEAPGKSKKEFLVSAAYANFFLQKLDKFFDEGRCSLCKKPCELFAHKRSYSRKFMMIFTPERLQQHQFLDAPPPLDPYEDYSTTFIKGKVPLLLALNDLTAAKLNMLLGKQKQ